MGNRLQITQHNEKKQHIFHHGKVLDYLQPGIKCMSLCNQGMKIEWE